MRLRTGIERWSSVREGQKRPSRQTAKTMFRGTYSVFRHELTGAEVIDQVDNKEMPTGELTVAPLRRNPNSVGTNAEFAPDIPSRSLFSPTHDEDSANAVMEEIGDPEILARLNHVEARARVIKRAIAGVAIVAGALGGAYYGNHHDAPLKNEPPVSHVDNNEHTVPPSVAR